MYIRMHSPTLTTRMLQQYARSSFPIPFELSAGQLGFIGFCPPEERTAEVTFWVGSYERLIYMAQTRFGVDFVNVRLEPDDKPRFLEWQKANQADLAQYIGEMLGSGYKVSVNLDDKNDCYIVAVTGTTNCRDNRGLCMTTRSDDWLEAICMAVFKHYVICDAGSWGTPEQHNQSWG